MDSLVGIAVELCVLCASGESEQRYISCSAVRPDQDATHRRYVLACLLACTHGKLSLRIHEFFEAGAELGRIEEFVSFVQITCNPDARGMTPSSMDIHQSRRRGSATTYLRQDHMTRIWQPDRRYTFGLKIRQSVRLWRDRVSSGSAKA